jgi:hypothetical protein
MSEFYVGLCVGIIFGSLGAMVALAIVSMGKDD